MKRPFGSSFLLVVLLLSMNSCFELGQGDRSGICQTADGAVNTHQLVGTWKLVDGEHSYEEPDGIYLSFEARSRAQVSKGSDLCTTEVDNGGKKCLLISGRYDNYSSDHFYEADYASLQVTEVCNPPSLSSEKVDYSFSGSCNDTKLTLNYPGGASEVYRWYNSESSCKSN